VEAKALKRQSQARGVIVDSGIKLLKIFIPIIPNKKALPKGKAYINKK
jgi:hypothetical protein